MFPRISLALSLCLFLSLACSGPAIAGGHPYLAFVDVQLSKPQVNDGETFLVRVKTKKAGWDPAQKLKLKAWDKEISFYVLKHLDPAQADSETVAEAIVGVPYLMEPGHKTLDLVETKSDGSLGDKVQELSIEVIAATYKSEELTVDPKHVNPPASVKERIEKEIKLAHEVYARKSGKKYWKSNFALPIRSELTSMFGTKRIFNGDLKSSHLGIDLRAKENTPIRAPEGGVVALAKNLYYTGNTVLIDHGFGLITLYAHMNKRLVKAGDVVKKGRKIGLSGATGRVSGPHLHWGAILHEVKINPLSLTKDLAWKNSTHTP